MVVDLKKAFAAVVEFEKAHGRKIAAGAVYVLTHPVQVHDTVTNILAQVHALLSGAGVL